MKYISLLFIIPFILTSQTSMAQDYPCYFDEYTNNKSILETEQIIQYGVNNLQFSEKTDDSIKTIPVVIHVLHTNGSENISEAQIQSQIQILNEDYGKITGSNGDGLGVDTKVRFCLAKIDSNGNCTNGIVRIYTPLTNHKTYERALLKQLSFWDNTKYLNIYLVKTITGNVLGYSSFPGGPPDEDGMVIRHDVFGNIGTAGSSLGRTASHEIGHWFGLYHTFNNGCGTDLCLDGDFVCDTPPQNAPSYNCTNLNSCSNDIPDVNDQKENYMNYTNDACKNMFTNGQKLRVQSTLENIRTNIWSFQNLNSTGCDSLYSPPVNCDIVADFITLTPTVCVGNTVNFMDKSLNSPNSWSWSFPGGVPSTSTLQNPSVTYPTVGSFMVKLVISDGLISDSVSLSNYIIVTTPGIGSPLPYSEKFDSGIFPPTDISINNLDGGITWELDSNAYVSPNYSVRINNLINTNYGSSDEIILPYLDFTTFTSNLFMSFDYAYARSDPSYSDELIVLLSSDCGVNYTQVHYRSGGSLVTGPTQTTPFIPDSSQWNHANFSLNGYTSKQYVQIKIVNVTDGGNNLYIDNINIGELNSSVSSIEKKHFTLYPNPTSETLYISFSDNTNKTIRLFNSIGQTILNEFQTDQLQYAVDISEFSSGIYYLEINQGTYSTVEKIIIK